MRGEAEDALELPGVVVAVPDGDLALGERGRDARAACMPATLNISVGARSRGVAVERHAVDRAQAVERGRQQRLLVRAHRLEVELEHVLGRGAHAGERLERQRPELPAVRRLVGRRVELVRAELLEQLRAGAEDADVRAEPLVGRAGEHVGAERGEVVAAVRGGVDGVDVDARADARARRRRSRRGPGTVPIALEAAVTATQRVRSDSTASTADAGSSSVLRSGSAKRTRRAGALGRDHPRAHVGVVVQARADDLVAGPQRAPDGGREAHRHRGDARAEGDARGLAAEQPRDRGARAARRARRSRARA